MNINFLIDKENERVVVSNEKGTMNPREYQDNIEEVLVTQDVVEGLESDYKFLKIGQTSLKEKLENINNKIKNKKNDRKNYFKVASSILAAAPVICAFLFIAINRLEGDYSLLNAGLVGLCADSIPAIVLFGAFPSHLKLSAIKKLEEEKTGIEKEIKDQDLQIFHLEQVLYDAKNQLQYMLKQKEKKNIQNMPTEIQKVPYLEVLTARRQYLIEMYEANKTAKQEPLNQVTPEPKGSLLGRFKKKKQY